MSIISVMSGNSKTMGQRKITLGDNILSLVPADGPCNTRHQSYLVLSPGRMEEGDHLSDL